MEGKPIDFMIHHLIDAWNDTSKLILNNPTKVFNNQTQYFHDYLNIWQNSPTEHPNTFDKRFQHADWQDNVVLNTIKQCYFLFATHIEKFISDIAEHDEKLAKKLHFYTQQFIDASAPTNFVNINPDVLSKTFETNGANLVDGLKQFLEDISHGSTIKIADFDVFKVGENIACTPGKVIYQNDLMQLIQYSPTTQKIYQNPLLIIPPWINKYYILDLQPENSFVKWLVGNGVTVFMISWVNPTSLHRDKQFENYMVEGPLTAFDIIKKLINADTINALGYCVGGTLLACTLAYLAKHNLAYVGSATFLTTLLDFSEPGELGNFIDEKQISFLEDHMKTNGYLDGNIMAAVFNSLRANDLIWSSFINNYLKGQKPKAFDLLHWNSDATNIPEKVHSFYLRNMYLNNHLVKRNQISLGDTPLDLANITIPSYFLATHDDHIVPWTTCYKSKQNLGGPVKFVLASSGHVAGVINPPHKNKYGYWTNTARIKRADNFLKTAKFHTGSWWNDWEKWLVKYSGELCSADALHFANQTVIEDAPGSYVKVRLFNSR